MDPSLRHHNLKLSPEQEEALFAALNSNKDPAFNNTSLPASTNGLAMAPSAFTESPMQGQAPGSGTLNGFDDSPFIDYDYEFEQDGSFDFGDFNDTQGQMIGQLPGTSSDGDDNSENIHDKRSHPEDDGEDDEGGGKRREGEEKTSKKPGRKPLTSEPTSKRKAQNRAAQRAFRERKEKHLKDLETKVEDLQKASESANHENSILRAQIEKMSMELREYKKRLSVTGTNTRASSFGTGLPPYLTGKGLGGGAVGNLNDVNFQFDFPRFGRLPGPNGVNNTNRQSTSPTVSNPAALSPIDRQSSPRNQSYTSTGSITQSPAQLDNGDMSSLSGLFSPSLLESVNKTSPFDFLHNGHADSAASRSSTESNNGTMSNGHNTSYSSPSASSNSNHGPSSSCGTSPEPTGHSPGKAADFSLTTIGEENCGTAAPGETTFCEKLNMACGNPNNPVPRTMSEPSVNSGNPETPAFDINGIDWFAQQNNNEFDPQLFGDYREPQENVLSNGAFSDAFFQDAFALPDFNTPFNAATSPAPPKKGLLQEIDERQNADDEVVPGEDTTKMLTCNTIWDRLQACPKVKGGEFDLDNLCKDLQKKAKCSETGAVVNEADFNKIMNGYISENKGLKEKKATTA
ncbi:hypothetical protein BP5796_03991 [Coleophoma crateriformis]|uniref:BZIP domain-containing protein n=1 Tax=Coleophoma crateriformis TaxID=565419 RepID=A0A3D8SH83_9HELO|nr:hypothetical protein BP5796_03991 [Coleophoma crateriformis]